MLWQAACVEMLTSAIDAYLVRCVRACISGTALPPWETAAQASHEAQLAHRVLFHGIALLLTQHQSGRDDWPDGVTRIIREEARLQTFWEASHHDAIAEVTEALHQHGLDAVIMKGTALAYSLYGDPATRRRGDTDLVALGQHRDAVRDVLRQAGFVRSKKTQGLQESWKRKGADGFVHEIDLHWAMSSSPMVSRALDTIKPRTGWIALPRLSPHARCLNAAQSLLMTCLNRANHNVFGYYVDNAKLRESDRLIWAIDLHLLCTVMENDDWRDVTAMAQASGMTSIVKSGLEFAQHALASKVPDWVMAQLDHDIAPHGIGHYIETASQWERLRMDWAASDGVLDRLALLQRNSFPDPSLLRERYPEQRHWPLIALYARRLGETAIRLVRR
jgi:hypothetical protein